MKNLIDNFIVSEGCVNNDGKHICEPADSPYYRKCISCGKKFYLIEESVFDKLKISFIERPTKEN